MGPETQKALKEFQTSKGINASGQLDQQTLAALGVSGSAAGGASAAKPAKKTEGSAAAGASASTEKKTEGSAAAGASSTEQKPQEPQAPAKTETKPGEKKY
jgi:peptidoglycan hydrolase-like protein with peptidoglycan-binding domain